MLTLVFLQNAQVFRLLLKTSVERNVQEFKLFLVGFAVWLRPLSVSNVKQLSVTAQRCT